MWVDIHYTEAPEGYNRGEAQHCHCYALLRKAALVDGVLYPFELALHDCWLLWAFWFELLRDNSLSKFFTYSPADAESSDGS